MGLRRKFPPCPVKCGRTSQGEPKHPQTKHKENPVPVFRSVTDQNSGEIKLEAIHQPLYDSASILAATGVYSYFQNPSGRSAFETNLQTAGVLSWPKRFSIKAIRQVPAFGALWSDLVLFFSNATLQISVGEKTYLTLPAFMVTAGVGLEGQTLVGAAAPGAPTNSINYANNGRPNQQNIYSLVHSVFIPPVQNFSVTLTVGTAPANAFRNHLFLEGELLREIQ
jgi:hypothetical protein